MSIIMALIQLIKDILASDLFLEVMVIAASAAVAILAVKVLTNKRKHKQTGGL